MTSSSDRPSGPVDAQPDRRRRADSCQLPRRVRRVNGGRGRSGRRDARRSRPPGPSRICGRRLPKPRKFARRACCFARRHCQASSLAIAFLALWGIARVRQAVTDRLHAVSERRLAQSGIADVGCPSRLAPARPPARTRDRRGGRVQSHRAVWRRDVHPAGVSLHAPVGRVDERVPPDQRGEPGSWHGARRPWALHRVPDLRHHQVRGAHRRNVVQRHRTGTGAWTLDSSRDRAADAPHPVHASVAVRNCGGLPVSAGERAAMRSRASAFFWV